MIGLARGSLVSASVTTLILSTHGGSARSLFHERHAVAPHCLLSSFDLMCCFCTAITGDHDTIQARQETAGWPRFDRMFMRTARVFFRNPVFLHLYALLCDVRVSMINQSVIGVIYRSGGSVHTAGPTAGGLAGALQVRR